MPRTWLIRAILLLSMASITLASVSCAPATPVATLEVRPAGKVGEILSWTSTALEKGPRHRIRLSVDVDPAKLMGWARTSLQYRVLADVRFHPPEGEVRTRTLVVPITEARKIGEDPKTGTIRLAHRAAGTLLENGFRRTEPIEAYSVWPKAGHQKISVRMRIEKGANRNALKAIRSVRVEVLARGDGGGVLGEWAQQPAEFE